MNDKKNNHTENIWHQSRRVQYARVAALEEHRAAGKRGVVVVPASADARRVHPTRRAGALTCRSRPRAALVLSSCFCLALSRHTHIHTHWRAFPATGDVFLDRSRSTCNTTTSVLRSPPLWTVHPEEVFQRDTHVFNHLCSLLQLALTVVNPSGLEGPKLPGRLDFCRCQWFLRFSFWLYNIRWCWKVWEILGQSRLCPQW